MKATIVAVILSASQLVNSASAAASGEDWMGQINLKGDVRLRYEGIDEESKVNRDRMRFRIRFGLVAAVRDDINVVLRFATGGTNPVSTNQTFDEGFSTKDIGLDLAYVDWTLNDALAISAGKMKNPLFKAGKVALIWDGDLNPEGFAVKFDSGNLFGTIAGFSVEERGSADDSLLFAAQGGVKLALGNTAELIMGIGYFAYTETSGNQPFFNGKDKGNSVDLNGNYIFDYKNTEVFAELDSQLGAWPLKVFAHYTQNNEVDIQDTAYAFGAQLGSAKKVGDFRFAWIYQDIEADALIGTFNDSDFAGGGTDSKGHVFKVKYSLSGKLFLGGTFFVNDKDRLQGIEHDYDRVQIDLELKFD